MRIEWSGIRVSGFEFRVLGSGFQVPDFEFRVPGFGFQHRCTQWCWWTGLDLSSTYATESRSGLYGREIRGDGQVMEWNLG